MLGKKVGRQFNNLSEKVTRHTGLNISLYKIGKHPTGKCTHCNEPETVEHVLF